MKIAIIVFLSLIYYVANSETADTTKYATLKVIGLQSPKLLIFGYEYQSSYTALLSSASVSQSITIKSKSRYKMSALIPIINKPGLIFSLSVNYQEHNFVGSEKTSEPVLTNQFYNTLTNYSLKSSGLTGTMFYAFNKKTFILFNGGFEISNNLQKTYSDKMYYAKYSVVGLLGFRPSERRLVAFGLSRGYRGGRLNYFPVFIYNASFRNNFGIELTFPSKLMVSKKLKSNTRLYSGIEMEGTSYNLSQVGIYKNAEFRFSEFKCKLMCEQKIYKLLWFSFETGLRLNNNFHVNATESDSKKEAIITSKLSNPMYFGVNLILVSPK